MPRSPTRRQTDSTRVGRFDRFVLPAVTLLLLIGAVIIIVAWSYARQAMDARTEAIEDRATRVAEVVHATAAERWSELELWAETNQPMLKRGRGVLLQREVDRRVADDLSRHTLAWLVVRADGGVEALGEFNKGKLIASGIGDDVRVFARTVAARGKPNASGGMTIDGRRVVAFGVPVDSPDPGGQMLAIVVVRDVADTGLALFVNDAAEKVDMLGRVALLDGRGRVVIGSDEVVRGTKIQRPVAGTDWTVELVTRDPTAPLIGWFYPAFALLLVIAAGVFSLQGLAQRRMKREHDDRSMQVHDLYDLASRVLHAETIEDQAEDLALTAIQLTGADGASVHVTTSEGSVRYATGETHTERAAKVRVPIIGPRATLGELVLARASGVLDEEETWVVQTAATLAGAAIHTRASLETERAASADLQRLDELRSNLMATVAHELLSPLTAVKGVLGLLSMQDDLGERGRAYVDVATERTDRLVALIRDLFDCSLIETGQLDIRPRRQRADELLEAALGAQAAATPDKLRLSATPNLFVTVDPVRFDQLVTNLVTNAFRHGEPPVEVNVRPADNGVLVVVTDEGRGIPPESRDEIFGKFWQESSGPARLAEGAGLGLNLVRGLVELHGGCIWIDATHADGRGARFTVFLPDEVPNMTIVSDAESSEPKPTIV
ncbi:MAG: ATP-binding protein [Gaiellales bacterium]